MSSPIKFRPFVRIMIVLLIVLGACRNQTGEEPTATKSVVVATEVPIVETNPVAAPEMRETAVPLPIEDKYTTYEHPTGAFSLDLPAETEYQESEEGVLFREGESTISAFFVDVDTSLDAGTVSAITKAILDHTLLGKGLASEYQAIQPLGGEGDMYSVAFQLTPNEGDSQEGGLILTQIGQTIYGLMLLTPDYEAVSEVWSVALDSFTPHPIEASNKVLEIELDNESEAKQEQSDPEEPILDMEESGMDEAHLPASGQAKLVVSNETPAELTFKFESAETLHPVPPHSELILDLEPGHHAYILTLPDQTVEAELTVQADQTWILEIDKSVGVLEPFQFYP